MSDERLLQRVKPTFRIRWLFIYAVLLLVVFLFGFVPMWLKCREYSNSLTETSHQLSIARIENALASAVIDARRGDYEPARQAASNFFTSLRAETDRGNDSVFSQTQRDGLLPLFVRRDETITLLARNEPVSADRLLDLYVSYRKIMNK
jgi:hypothetical protein